MRTKKLGLYPRSLLQSCKCKCVTLILFVKETPLATSCFAKFYNVDNLVTINCWTLYLHDGHLTRIFKSRLSPALCPSCLIEVQFVLLNISWEWCRLIGKKEKIWERRRTWDLSGFTRKQPSLNRYHPIPSYKMRRFWYAKINAHTIFCALLS